MKKLLLILGMAMTIAAISPSVGEMAAQPGHYTTQPIRIIRLDPAFDRIVPKDAVLEKVADGFVWVESPLWNRAEGYLLFSELEKNGTKTMLVNRYAASMSFHPKANISARLISACPRATAIGVKTARRCLSPRTPQSIAYG